MVNEIFIFLWNSLLKFLSNDGFTFFHLTDRLEWEVLPIAVDLEGWIKSIEF